MMIFGASGLSDIAKSVDGRSSSDGKSEASQALRDLFHVALFGRKSERLFEDSAAKKEIPISAGVICPPNSLIAVVVTLFCIRSCK